MENEQQRGNIFPTQRKHPVCLYAAQKISCITDSKIQAAKLQYDYLKHAFEDFFDSIEVVDVKEVFIEELNKKKIDALIKISFLKKDKLLYAFHGSKKREGISYRIEWKMLLITKERIEIEKLIESNDVSFEVAKEYQYSKNTTIEKQDYGYMYLITFPTKSPYVTYFIKKFEEICL